MTHAYDKICLERAADTLGRMLDYSFYSLHYDISTMMDLFIASGTAALFESGDIRTIAGMSGVELAYEVLERSGMIYERTQPRYTKGLSAEYWCGNALAHIQWETCMSFDRIMAAFSAQMFISEYGRSRISFLDALPLNISDEERSAKIKSFGRQFADEAVMKFTAAGEVSGSGKSGDTPLKIIRIKNSLSQSGLAKASGVPLRTIQQYEQRQKDISKARAEYLIALSRALSCDPSLLI
jgi:DNA-binding transcriptional regulator YiaG